MIDEVNYIALQDDVKIDDSYYSCVCRCCGASFSKVAQKRQHYCLHYCLACAEQLGLVKRIPPHENGKLRYLKEFGVFVVRVS